MAAPEFDVCYCELAQWHTAAALHNRMSSLTRATTAQPPQPHEANACLCDQRMFHQHFRTMAFHAWEQHGCGTLYPAATRRCDVPVTLPLSLELWRLCSFRAARCGWRLWGWTDVRRVDFRQNSQNQSNKTKDGPRGQDDLSVGLQSNTGLAVLQCTLAQA